MLFEIDEVPVELTATELRYLISQVRYQLSTDRRNMTYAEQPGKRILVQHRVMLGERLIEKFREAQQKLPENA